MTNKCPACNSRHLIPDGVEILSHGPITVTTLSKATREFSVWITLVAKFHCQTCLYPFEETVNKATTLANPAPVGMGGEAQVRRQATDAIKHGWDIRMVGRRVPATEQGDYFVVQGWKECHETLKKSPTRKKIGVSQVHQIMSLGAAPEYLRALSLHLSR